MCGDLCFNYVFNYYIVLNSEIINVYVGTTAVPVLISICGTFGTNNITLSIVSTKLEFFGTCKISCLICILNMVVLLGILDSFDSVFIWLDLVGIQWYWMSSGTDIANVYLALIGNC